MILDRNEFEISRNQSVWHPVTLSAAPASILDALIPAADCAAEQALASIVENLPEALLKLQRAGIELRWRHEDGLAFISIAAGLLVRRAEFEVRIP